MPADDVRYYRVSPRFWSRAEQKGWSDDAKLLALYLLTGPHRTTEGLYRLPKKYAQADLEWSRERFDQPLAELIHDGFCDYDEDAQVVLVSGAMRYQACANENMAKAAVKRLKELPETRLARNFQQLAERFDQRLHEQLPEGFGEPQALALAPPQAQAPSPGESPPGGGSADGESDAEDPSTEARIVESFEEFWNAYPDRDGKKIGKRNALIEWRKLTWDQRRRAYLGAVNLAASDQIPKDPERFLRRSKGGKGDYPFDDWQEPAKPSTNGHSSTRSLPASHQVSDFSESGMVQP